IPEDWPSRVVREDPDREGLLYVGTEFAMFISFDNGAHWQPFQLNLPNVPVTDIKLHHQDLIVSTQGRAFWILDNISSLHQLGSQIASSSIHLFTPREGYRTRIAPANLAPAIQYYLPPNVAGAVTIDILDAKGALINSYNAEPATSTGREGRTGAGMPGSGGVTGDADDPDAPASRRAGAPPPRVTKFPGMNRVVWDLRNKDGVTVPPGQYQVRLKVGETDLTENLTVLIDPRIAADGVTVADLQ